MENVKKLFFCFEVREGVSILVGNLKIIGKLESVGKLEGVGGRGLDLILSNLENIKGLVFKGGFEGNEFVGVSW